MADRANIEKLAAEPDVLDQLAASLAPSIYGHRTIKKGLLMLLLGGDDRQPQPFKKHVMHMQGLFCYFQHHVCGIPWHHRMP